MEIVASVVIDCHVEDVFAHVCDPANDAGWLFVEQVAGDGPGPGARWTIVHRSVPLRPPRRMAYECVSFDPPAGVAWRGDDGDGRLLVAYALEAVWTATRLTRRDEARPATAWPATLLRRRMRRDVRGRLQALKGVLERG